MGSKFLSSLSEEGYKNLTNQLYEAQDKKCFICEDEIDFKLHSTNIDHIIPMANRGKDNEHNFALTHESCNKSKQDANLRIAKSLAKLRKIESSTNASDNKVASLEDVLKYYDGSKYKFKYTIENDIFKYSFSDLKDNKIYQTQIYQDNLSGEKSVFIEVPIEYLYHDKDINPRGINSSISKLVKEFDKKNPQLHLSLARIDDGKLKIFDGQHKAVAQILLNTRKFVIRIFIEPDINRLTQTNTNAGSTLKQIAFDRSVMRQLNNTLYLDRIKRYQKEHELQEDDFSFSEQQLVDYFKGDGSDVKKYIVDAIKDNITHSSENKLRNYIDFEGKAKNLPISYSAFDKTILAKLISSKLILKTPINHREDSGLNPREVEIEQIIKLLNILAEAIYINKFKIEIGTSTIEQKIINKRDTKITDEHLIAFRISKEEIMHNWLQYLIAVIENYRSNTGKLPKKEGIFQERFDEQLWINIANFVKNLSNLPLWKDRGMANTIFGGKNTYDYWKEIFETGKARGVTVLLQPINIIEMIKSE